MKRLLLAATLTVASLSANATKQDEKQTQCENMYEYAETIMKARQNGIPMTKMRDIVKSTNDKPMIALGNSLIEWAYSEPKYHSEEMQKYATNKFAEIMYYGCKEVFKWKKK